MVVLATGHQIGCIHWVQVAIFNKRIDFLCEILCIEFILWRILATKSMFDVAIMLKINCQKCANE